MGGNASYLISQQGNYSKRVDLQSGGILKLEKSSAISRMLIQAREVYKLQAGGFRWQLSGDVEKRSTSD